MTIKNANLDGILAELTRRRAEKQAGEQGDKDTTHPIKDAPNSTQDGSTGASASEDSADVKDQQPIGVENTGGPTEEANPSGSMGVEDKKPNESADLETGDTSGLSEMANTGTTHPSAGGDKRGSALDKAAEALKALDAAIKQASNSDEEKLAEYVKALETEHADAVAEGEKFAEHVLGALMAHEKNANEAALAKASALYGVIKTAATNEDLKAAGGEEGLFKAASELAESGVTPEELVQAIRVEASSEKKAGDAKSTIKFLLKHAASAEDLAAMGGEPGLDSAAAELAEAGVDPAELEAALMAEEGGGDMAGGGEDAEIMELAAALEEAGVTPEQLEAALAQGQLGEPEQQAALDAAMGESGVGPEDIAAMGGELPMEVVGSADRVKIAKDKQGAFLALKNRLVTELKQLKEGATK